MLRPSALHLQNHESSLNCCVGNPGCQDGCLVAVETSHLRWTWVGSYRRSNVSFCKKADSTFLPPARCFHIVSMFLNQCEGHNSNRYGPMWLKAPLFKKHSYFYLQFIPVYSPELYFDSENQGHIYSLQLWCKYIYIYILLILAHRSLWNLNEIYVLCCVTRDSNRLLPRNCRSNRSPTLIVIQPINETHLEESAAVNTASWRIPQWDIFTGQQTWSRSGLMSYTGRLALQHGWLSAAGSRFLPLKITPHHQLPLGWGQNLSVRLRPLQGPFIRNKSLKRTTSSSFSHWCKGILVSGVFIAVASRVCDHVLCPAQVGTAIQGEAATFCSRTFCLRAFPSQGYLAATEKQPHASKIWCLVAAAGTASALARDCETLLSSQFCAVQHWKALDRIHDLPVASSD